MVVEAPRSVFKATAKGRAGGGAAAASKQNDRHTQLGTLLLKAELGPDALERLLAVCRLVFSLATDLLRPGQGFTDVPVVMLGTHYLSQRQLADKHKGDTVQLFLQELSSHEALAPTPHGKYSAPGAAEIAQVQLSVRPECAVHEHKAGLGELLGLSSSTGMEPYIECKMQGSGFVTFARHGEQYTFSLPDVVLLSPLQEDCQLDMGGSCDIRCQATGLSAHLRFKRGQRVKGSVQRAGAHADVALIEGSWDGQVTVESVEMEASGTLFEAAQLMPPLAKSIKLAEPGPRLCPRLWSALLESLICVDAQAAAKLSKKAADLAAELPRHLKRSLLYEVESSGRPPKQQQEQQGAQQTGSAQLPLPPCVLAHRAKHGAQTYQLSYRLQALSL